MFRHRPCRARRLPCRCTGRPRASGAAWADVLAASKNRKCWSDASVVTRARVRALATLRRYEECVREGKGVTDPKIANMVEVCRARMETK
jgi:hypothetical protein